MSDPDLTAIRARPVARRVTSVATGQVTSYVQLTVEERDAPAVAGVPPRALLERLVTARCTSYNRATQFDGDVVT